MKVVRGLKADLQNLRIQCGRDTTAMTGIVRRMFEDFGGWVSLASPLSQRDYEDAHTSSGNLPKYKNISQQVLQSYISQATVKLLALQKRNAFLHNQVQVKRVCSSNASHSQRRLAAKRPAGLPRRHSRVLPHPARWRQQGRR